MFTVARGRGHVMVDEPITKYRLYIKWGGIKSVERGTWAVATDN